MHLLTKLFVLATFLGSLSAIDRKEPMFWMQLETPDWFNNPPHNYVAAVGSTIEKAFINVLHDYAQLQTALSEGSKRLDTLTQNVNFNIPSIQNCIN